MKEFFEHLPRPRDEAPSVRPGTPELRAAILEALTKNPEKMRYPEETL